MINFYKNPAETLFMKIVDETFTVVQLRNRVENTSIVISKDEDIYGRYSGITNDFIVITEGEYNSIMLNVDY